MLYFFSLGSNLGDRFNYMDKMEAFLESLLDGPVNKSSLMETSPVDVKDAQNAYLNRIVSGYSNISPKEMLILCQKEEIRLGRDQKGEKLSRTADIDILFAQDTIISTDNLTVPHLAICERRFIIEGLYELDKDFLHPLLLKSIAELKDEYCSKLQVQEIHIIK